MKLSRILHPTDFSELSLHSLHAARGLAEQFGAELTCLHVVDEACEYWMSMGPDSVPVGPVLGDVVASAKKHMEQFVADHLADASFPVTSAVTVGRPFLEIIAKARELPADMIVLSTHGRTGLSHILLGSVAEKVVRKAPCPVLTIRHPDYEFKMP